MQSLEHEECLETERDNSVEFGPDGVGKAASHLCTQLGGGPSDQGYYAAHE